MPKALERKIKEAWLGMKWCTKAENILNLPFNMQHVSIELILDIKMLKVERESGNKIERRFLYINGDIILFELLLQIQHPITMRCCMEFIY